ncbi:hypothetical protein RCH18_000408 [Flavobacterium sp. PL11]|nr:hypothetical protein [Flavobacterium sp. PL11]
MIVTKSKKSLVLKYYKGLDGKEIALICRLITSATLLYHRIVKKANEETIVIRL